MPTERNLKAVEDLTEVFKDSSLVIATEYRGLNVQSLQGLRRALRENGTQFTIAKNTLARIAADNAGKAELKEIIDGPIGFLTTNGDPAAAAKALVTYLGDNRLDAKIVGGLLESSILSGARIQELAKLPSRDQLISMMLGGMNSPITGLVTVMAGPVRALATVLQRHVEKQGAGAAA
jgi:large subunit ribosomal protein L10